MKNTAEDWLREFGRPDLIRKVSCLWTKADSIQLEMVNLQHPEHSVVEAMARAKARTLCHQYPQILPPAVEVLLKRRPWVRIAIWVLVALVCLLAGAALGRAQGIDVIRVQNNGTPVGTIAGPFTLNCVLASATPCTIAASPRTLNIAVGGGGGGTITLQTNGTNNISQTALNLVAGTNVTLTNTSGGNVTVAASGSGSGYTASSWIWGSKPLSRYGGSGSGAQAIVNKMDVFGVEITTPIRVSNLLIDVIVQDPASALYSYGIYGPLSSCSTTCPLVASTTAQKLPATGRVLIPLAGGAVTISPGIYFEGWTTNETSATAQLALAAGFGSDRSQFYLAYDASTTTTGGAAAASITTPVMQIIANPTAFNQFLPMFYLLSISCPSGGCS
ncbi:MAG: hypothetical protein ACREKE_07885 [bacterium]